MSANKSSTSKARSHRELGDYWDVHDLSKSWDKTAPARFLVRIESEAVFVAVDRELSERLRMVADHRGVSADTLVNLWIQEKLRQERRHNK